MENEIKDIIEILELSKEEIENNDENVTAILDLEDLKALKNLYNLYLQEKEKNKDLQKQLNDAFDRGFIHKDNIEEKLENKIDELSKIHNTTKDIFEKEISKGMALLLKCVKRDLLEEK